MTFHVYPLRDLVDHATELGDDTDCVCGPEIRPVVRADGSFAWLIVHHSLDGREHREHPPDG